MSKNNTPNNAIFKILRNLIIPIHAKGAAGKTMFLLCLLALLERFKTLRIAAADLDDTNAALSKRHLDARFRPLNDQGDPLAVLNGLLRVFVSDDSFDAMLVDAPSDRHDIILKAIKDSQLLRRLEELSLGATVLIFPRSDDRDGILSMAEIVDQLADIPGVNLVEVRNEAVCRDYSLWEASRPGEILAEKGHIIRLPRIEPSTITAMHLADHEAFGSATGKKRGYTVNEFLSTETPVIDDISRGVLEMTVFRVWEQLLSEKFAPCILPTDVLADVPVMREEIKGVTRIYTSATKAAGRAFMNDLSKFMQAKGSF